MSEFQTFCRRVETDGVAGELSVTEVRYVADDGVPVVTTVAQVAAARVAGGQPCRRVRSHAHARHWVLPCTSTTSLTGGPPAWR